MPAPRVLFVKLSSLGDVIHHLPAVTDLRAQRPEARIHWAVEQAYAELVALHPAVERAIPVGLRRVRAEPFSSAAWGELLAARRQLRAEHYDYVVDTQGLAKSAAVAASARGAAFGFDRASAREPISARFYDVGISVSRELHAVDRNRRLVAGVFGYSPDAAIDYGLEPPGAPPAWAPEGRYYVALHAASRAEKRWADDRWVTLALRLATLGLVAVYPGGSDIERAQAAALAAASPGALAAPAMSLAEAARLLAGAECVAGVDTGLTHLAVALGRPTVGIYCATDPALTGLRGGARVKSLGAPGRPPSAEAVEAALGFGPAASASAESTEP